jgi:probable F420-dependent oxidoreductase
VEPESVTRIVQAAETAGFHAVAMTDHPAPSRKWLDTGGHASFDPLTALAFCAAATSRIRLMTYVLVLPYRNPLLAARQIATVDRLSGGRLDVVVGPGYLRSEFSALGVDHDSRGDILDESLEVLKCVFTEPEFRFEGRGFTARGVAIEPAPVQHPHPPIWIGGNGIRARRRAAILGNGWSPIQMNASGVETTGTVPLDGDESIAWAIEDLDARIAEAGRERSEVTVQLHSAAISDITATERDRVRTRVDELAAIGIDQLVMVAPGDDVERCLNEIGSFGQDVLNR